MAAPLSLVDAEGATATPAKVYDDVSDEQAAAAFADDLKSQGWCIRTSTAVSMLFDPDSERESNFDLLAAQFGAFAERKRIRVKDYPKFLESLRSRVLPRLPVIQGDTFRPVPQKFVTQGAATLANTYKPFAPPRPADDDAAPFRELLGRLFPDKDEQKWVVQYLAHIIQKPMERPQYGLLITGEGGTCKSLLIKSVIRALGGNHGWQRSEWQQVSGRFSEVLPNNLVVCLDDSDEKLPKDAAEHLKEKVTCTHSHVEGKGEQKLVKREVYARIVILSNKPRPLRLDGDANQRRWYCPARISHQKDKDDSAEFGARYHAWLEQPDTAAKLYWYFKDVSLEGFTVGRCPWTETNRQMAEASVSQLDRHIDDFLQDRTSDDGVQPIFHESTLLAYLTHNGQRNVNTDSIKMKLTERGYDNSKRRKLGPPKAQKDVRVWQPVATRSRSLTPDEEAEIKDAAGLGLDY